MLIDTNPGRQKALKIALLVFRVILGISFIITGVIKSINTPLVVEHGLGAGLSEWLIPGVEILAGLLLIRGLALKPSYGRTAIYWLARIVLGLIFAYSGLVKIADVQLFVMAVENYRLLPDFLAPLMAVVLPWVELTAGLILIAGIKPLPAVTLINVMLAVFIVALGISYFRGLNIDCGCFNVNITDSSHSLLEAIWRDLAFLTTGLWLTGYLVLYKKERV